MFGILRYLFLKAVVVPLRLLIRLTMPLPKGSPDQSIYVASRDLGRKIRLHVYRPATSKSNGPSPVLINIHGSGFILPLHGSDDEFCALIARKTDYTVLDLQYRLAPEHPFPAALHDVEDVVQWVLKQQDGRYDPSRLAISGFSAGGNLALATAGVVFPKDTFRTILAFYPSTDKSIDPYDRKMPDPSGRASSPLLSRVFDACYIPPAVSRKNPLVSPSYAPADAFPRNVLIITAAQDNLCMEAEGLAARIEADSDRKRYVVRRRMEQCVHGWDKMAKPGTAQERAKDEAYALAVDMLQR